MAGGGGARKVKNIGALLLTSIFISAWGFNLIKSEKTRWVGMVLVPLPWVPLFLFFCYCQRNKGGVAAVAAAAASSCDDVAS